MATLDAAAPTGLTVVLVGPESSGKTTLAQALAEHYAAPRVDEVARSYLAARASYDAADLETIARAQHAAEQGTPTGLPLTVVDTDLVVIEVWWRERFGAPPDWLTRTLAATVPAPRRRYLLCAPDLPWEPDPLRENPDDRERLMVLYERRLTELAATFRVIAGRGAQRTAAAVAVVDGWLRRAP